MIWTNRVGKASHCHPSSASSRGSSSPRWRLKFKLKFMKGSKGSAPAGFDSGWAGARKVVAVLLGDGDVRVHLLISLPLITLKSGIPLI
jgi:hypothetical protein